MFKSPSPLPERARTEIADALNTRLADGLDLHSQIKVAHWSAPSAMTDMLDAIGAARRSAPRRAGPPALGLRLSPRAVTGDARLR
jgi:hypothetical protein